MEHRSNGGPIHVDPSRTQKRSISTHHQKAGRVDLERDIINQNQYVLLKKRSTMNEQMSALSLSILSFRHRKRRRQRRRCCSPWMLLTCLACLALLAAALAATLVLTLREYFHSTDET